MRRLGALLLFLFLLTGSGCSYYIERRVETTGYCDCGICTEWERGCPDFWNKYITKGPYKGKPHSGRTASGTRPRAPQPGLLSVDSLKRPYMIPVRLVFPWLWLAHDGTIAADTRYYPMGTRMFVPGYGWGRVEDRGGAIKGPRRLDLFFSSHRKARRWGRRQVEVRIYDP
ncbi:MAG TPA: 3D domain-containing protein [Terriglobales bacterium]|nr:3D domain-containing protein [Terriglobales bacterium]